MLLFLLRDLRAFWRLAQVAALIAGGLVIARCCFPFWNPTRCRFVKQAWAVRLLSSLGVRIDAQGGELPAGALIVSNHISWLDVFIINALAPTTFVCKSDVKHWPVIGALVEHTGTLFIERGNRAAAARSAQAIVERLRAGERVALFPEGTSTAGNHMLPFRATLFEAAIEARVQVQALALRYVDEASGQISLAPAYHGEISFGQSLLSIVRSPRFYARLHVLDPLDAVSDRRTLAHQSESAIASALGFPSPPTQGAPIETDAQATVTPKCSHHQTCQPAPGA